MTRCLSVHELHGLHAVHAVQDKSGEFHGKLIPGVADHGEKTDDGSGYDVGQEQHELQITMCLDPDEKYIRKEYLQRCDDQQYTSQIFHVVSQRVEEYSGHSPAAE